MGIRVGIDTGGTFTDLVGVDEESNRLIVAKRPSHRLLHEELPVAHASPDTVARSERYDACVWSLTHAIPEDVMDLART